MKEQTCDLVLDGEPVTVKVTTYEPGDEIPVTIFVCDTVVDMSPYPGLTSAPCECGEDAEFLCYPEDGACYCMTHKHHVHCARCGGIMQWG